MEHVVVEQTKTLIKVGWVNNDISTSLRSSTRRKLQDKYTNLLIVDHTRTAGVYTQCDITIKYSAVENANTYMDRVHDAYLAKRCEVTKLNDTTTKFVNASKEINITISRYDTGVMLAQGTPKQLDKFTIIYSKVATVIMGEKWDCNKDYNTPFRPVATRAITIATSAATAIAATKT